MGPVAPLSLPPGNEQFPSIDMQELQEPQQHPLSPSLRPFLTEESEKWCREHEVFKLRDLALGYDHTDLLDAGAPPCLVDVHNAAVEACQSKAVLSAKAAFWRASLLPPSAAVELAVTSLPLTSDQQLKARDFSRVMGLDRKVLNSREAVPPERPVPSEQVKSNRMAAALGELLMFNMSGSTKKHQFESCSADSEACLSQQYLSRLASFSHGTLTGALCAWRRYDLWCRSQFPAA